MKKTALIVAAAMLAMTACSESASTSTSSAAAESTSTVRPQSEDFEPTTNIRYYNIDTIQKNYRLCIEAQELTQKLSAEYQQLEYNLGSASQREQQQFQEKLQSNQFMTETEAQSAYNTVMQNAQGYQNRLLRRQNEIAEQLSAKQKELEDSINNFLTVYNNEHHYDAILVKSFGDHFNPKLDITDEILKGLNDRYKGAKEETKADAAAASTKPAAKK